MTYGVLIAEITDHPWAGWASWYRVTGPRAHVLRFLVEECTGDEAMALDMLAGAREAGS